MSPRRTYRSYTYKDAVFSICCGEFDVVTAEIVRQRSLLEEYLTTHKEYGESFVPVPALSSAPEVARRMAMAAEVVGVGPMAAVAGTMAQLAAEAGLSAGSREAIVENGGDVYLVARSEVTVVLHTGTAALANRLALEVLPAQTPLAICSSSGRMGHSTSLGECDLATVVANDCALADAAATLAANLVSTPADVDRALQRIGDIEGVDGVLIVKDDRIGMVGNLPRLVRRA